MSQTVEDLLNGAGTKPAQWDTIGTTHKGEVLSSEVIQARDIKTGEPKFWDDGSPVNQIRVIIQTAERDQDDADDDGKRALYLKGGKFAKDGAKTSLEACKDALKAAGAKAFDVGGQLALQYTCDGEPSNRGWNSPKLFKAAFKLPAPPAVDPDALL